ncbi:CD15/CS22/SEF14 family fimbrial major subunit [Escherichia coli]|uniref:CD15/CS22/SEF14 family fimbrial major subunit n=1 Tax=Escherichia coli TaxID=562 RepID=UPI001432C749|nr:CD15/CS22/SEF14 family fimbrial major subunit [Escherichia coli]NJZ74391.1 fimbrial protein [Escherichia coli]
MKKLSKIVLTVGLLGYAIAANAEDLSDNVTATATVNAPAKLVATYTVGAPLTTDNLKSQQIGTITLTGYNGTPVVADLNLSDAKGSKGYLELKNTGGNSLWAEAFIDGKSIKLNGQYVAGTQATGNLPAVTTNIDLKTWGSQKDIPAGEYTDNVTITLSNQ